VFDDVLGQEKAKEMFARALRERTLSHAYLLSGPEGLAKTAFARELAVALVSACGGCGACAECVRAAVSTPTCTWSSAKVTSSVSSRWGR
jgi:DNA polymerase-3 subunit delta'